MKDVGTDPVAVVLIVCAAVLFVAITAVIERVVEPSFLKERAVPAVLYTPDVERAPLAPLPLGKLFVNDCGPREPRGEESNPPQEKEEIEAVLVSLDVP